MTELTDELLADEDGLVGGELPGDFVGLTDLIGFGLPLGFGTGTDALAVWLGVGVSVLDEGWPAWCAGAADELGLVRQDDRSIRRVERVERAIAGA